MSCGECEIETIVNLLHLALCEPTSMYQKTKNSGEFIKIAKDEFQWLTSRQTRTVYTCLKSLLGCHVRTMDHARATFPSFRQLLPSLFKPGSSGAVPIHFFQMRQLFANHDDEEVRIFADDLFRKTRAEIRAENKRQRV